MNKKYEKAKLLLSSGKFKQARDVVSKYNKATKYKDIQAVLLEAGAVFNLGLLAKAKELFSLSLTLSPDSLHLSIIHFNISNIYSLEQNYPKAIENVKIAIENAPFEKRNELRFSLAQCYYNNRDYLEAIGVAKKLQVYKEFTVKALYLIVNSAVSLSDFETLDYHLRQLEGRLSELSSDQLEVLSMLICAHRQGDISASLNRIIQSGGDANVVNTMLSQHLLKEGDSKGAAEILSKVDHGAITELRPQKVFYETKGQLALDKNDVDLAFEQFNKMNQAAIKEFDGQNWKQRDHLELFKKLAKLDLNLDALPAEKHKRIAFLVGFPRSGTTLLDNILDAQPDIVALSEKPILLDVGKVAAQDGYKYPEVYTRIATDYRETLRELYYKKAEQYIDSDKNLDDCLLVDKNPLEMTRIPLILSIFPEAKIILAVRHPLDCILSCYMQNFHLNPQLAYFTDLESTFRRYREIFDLYYQFKDMYQFDDHVVRYEDIVEDINGTVGKLMDFLEFDDIDNDFNQFSQHAKKRVVNTPSAQQVRKGIYKQATYRWEKFSEKLLPFREIVEPYIKKYGY